MPQTAKIIIQIPGDLVMGAALTPQPPRSIIGQPYSYSGTISVTGGIPPYQAPFIVGPATSNGLTVSINGSTVTIAGIPTGNANLEVDVQDSTP